MAVKGKGKQIAGKPQASSPSDSSGKRKKPPSDASAVRDRRRKRRPGALQFFDDIAKDADYDDDEDEEEEDEEEEDLDFVDEGLDLDFSKGGKSEAKDYKGAGKSRYLPFIVKEEELSGDELEELIRDRYGRGSKYAVHDEDYKEVDDGVSVEHCKEDPNIWRVKCMVGKEQQIVLSLMHKYADLQRRGTKLEIISVFALEHVKGYVYMEADKECDVVEACKGFFNIYPATKLALVPVNDIPHLLSVRNKPCAISKGTWVRMKSGNYKGDLGQVVDYDEARRRATIKLVPRIDLNAIAKKYGGGISLKDAGVPSPRLLSSHELEHFRSHIEIRRDRHSGDVFEVLDGLMLKDGYLYKKVSITSIVCWGVQPSKDELLKFADTRKAEEEDVSWLSGVYNVRKKVKASPASDVKEDSEHGTGFKVHDLVLFGRKGFGVIIDMGKDGIKILKGDVEGQEAMTVKTKDIKSSCVDKMFTASDRNRKTISINDAVKVLEGPIEGREGIVKHLYKGTLFIYDETQEENSGIFCAKSVLCENTTPPKDSSRRAGNKASSSFNQSSEGSFEQEDSSLTFSRNRRSETNQTFSIGQTLRIRKGPLKGYLCRVVGIYRSDVTVKLDSLVKVITVQEQLLSVPNLRRDTSAEVPSDIFGSREIPTGGLPGNGEQTMGLSSWDGGSNSWQALSTSNFSFSTDKDQKTDQEQGADPWGSKVSLAARDNNQGADPWGSKMAPASGDSGGADPWGSKVAAGKESHNTDPWGSNVAGTSADQEQKADAWGSKTSVGDPIHSKKPLDSWEKASNTGGEQNSSWNKASAGGFENSSSDKGQGSDSWASKVSATGEEDHKQVADPWGSKAPLPSGEGGSDSWGSKKTIAAKEKEQGDDPWGSNVAGASRDTEQKTDPWGTKTALGDTNTLDSWAKSSTSGEQNSSWNKASCGGFGKDEDNGNNPSIRSTSATACGVSASDKEHVADPWGNKVSNAAKDHKQGADPWGSNATKASIAAEDQGGADPWGSKVAAGAREQEQGADPWGSNNAGASKDQGGADPWGSKVAAGAREQKQGADPWGNSGAGSSKDQGGSDPWSNKVAAVSTEQKQGADPWGSTVAGSSGDGGADPWGSKVAAGARDQKQGADPWGNNVAGESKEPNVDPWGSKASSTTGGVQNTSWNKASGGSWENKSSLLGPGPSSFSGEDTGKFDQRDSWDKPSNFEDGRGFGRGRGRGGNSWDRDGGNEGRENGWNNRERDSEGGWGFNRGRGRGRFGRRENNGDEDNNGGFGGGWGSGRGGGRGGRGRSDDGDCFGRGGRGRGLGRFQSSDRNNNDQDNSDCSWVNQQSSWSKLKGFEDGGGSSWNASKNEANNWNTSMTSESTGGAGSWGSSKQSEFKESSTWTQGKAGVSDATAGAGGNWDRPKPQSEQQSSGWNNKPQITHQSSVQHSQPSSGWNEKPWNSQQSGWNNTEKNEWSSSKSGGEPSFGVWIPKSTGNETGGDSWNKPKPSSGESSWGSKQPSDWNQNSTANEANKEAGSNDGNWGNKSKTFNSGNQSSGWGSNNDWSKLKPSFDDGGGDQSGGWNSGSSSFGGGRGDSFSSRGRGRGPRGGGRGGRDFNGGGQSSSGWSGGRGVGDQSKTFGEQTSNSNWNEQGFNGGENANKGSGDGWGKKDSGGNGGGSGWGQKDSVGDSGGSGWEKGSGSRDTMPQDAVIKGGDTGGSGGGWEKASGTWGSNSKDGNGGKGGGW